MEPSDEQKKIIYETGNLVVTAKPGSGKTYSIVKKICSIAELQLSYQGIIAISFTKKASRELESRCKKTNIRGTQHFFGTIDSFYISEIIVPFSSSLTLMSLDYEVRDSFDNHPEYESLRGLKNDPYDSSLILLLEKSLSEGHIFLEISGQTAFHIINSVPGCLLYLKAKYTHVFIDEYQDCGEIQHNIFLKLVSSGLIGTAVGDLDQAIYAFTDRYSRYLFSLIKDDNFVHREITHNHRCHKSISNYSLALMGVPDIQMADDNRVFKVNVTGNDEDIIRAFESKLSIIKKRFEITNNNDFAILCRSNISAERAAEFLETENKLFVDTALDNSSSVWGIIFNDLLTSFYLYKFSMTTKLDFTERYFNDDFDPINFDKGLRLIDELFSIDQTFLGDHLNKFIKFARLVHPNYFNKQICKVLEVILNDKQKLESFKPATKNEVNIMTLHKSKGLEFKCVLILDTYRWILPPEGRNIGHEEKVQALNLFYVGITRASTVCFIMQGTERYRRRQNDYYEAVESPFLNLHNTPDLRKDLIWK